MPSVHFDGQSFSVKGRRIWLTAAEFDYALVPAEAWKRHLEAARTAGFNALVVNCPWSLHEPRPGRFAFDGSLDIGAFADLCSQQELWLVLRIGPVVGGTYDGGGLPAWLSGIPGIKLREANPAFFDRVTRWYRALADRVAPKQASESGGHGRSVGPVVAVQIEDDWGCGSEFRAGAYLAELVRFGREVGFAVPMLTANRSWASVEGATDCWTGWDDLAATMRQLAHLEPERPRLVTLRDPSALRFLQAANHRRDSKSKSIEVRGAAERVAQALASGGQCVVSDAFSVTHHGATSGRQSLGGHADGFLASTARRGILFDEAGEARPDGGLLRRIIAFSSAFGHVLAQADHTRQAVVLDPESHSSPSVVPISGAGGSVAFLFAGQASGARTVPLLLPDGRRLGAIAGEGPVAWFAFDVDLNGANVLDYATISPLTVVEKRQLVLFGPAGADAEVSIDGVPTRVRVPAADSAKPTVVAQKRMTIVVCNESQADQCQPSRRGILVGRVGVDLDGEFFDAARPPAPKARVVPVSGGQVVPCTMLASGTSERYASLSGPSAFAACGARDGYGWYRLSFHRGAKSPGKVLVHSAGLADRATIWIGGELVGTFGAGPGARRFPIEIPLTSGDLRLSMLVEQLGRPVAGDHLGRRMGAFGALVEVAAIKATVEREPGKTVNPFSLRGFVYGMSEGDLGAGDALVWRFQHKRKSAVLLDLGEHPLPGTVTANGTPVARIGPDGPEDPALTIDPSVLAQGANEIRLVLDGDPSRKSTDALAKSATLHEVLQPLGGTPSWSFARWAPPEAWGIGGAATQGQPAPPTWMRGEAMLKERTRSMWLDLSSMSRGRAFINGRSVGRYFARDESGKLIGGQPTLLVPEAWLVAGKNEVVLFDERGLPPRAVVLR